VYKLKTWDDITLCSDLELPVPEGLPYAVSGNLIQVLAADLPRFINFWSEKAKVNFSINNFNQKLASCTEYGGVRWTVDTSGNYVGIIKQDNVQQLFDGCARAAQENLVK
jgi:endonuclease IV